MGSESELKRITSFDAPTRVAGDAVLGDKHVHAPAGERVKPAQLPRDDPDFTGRHELLQRLDALLDDAELSGTGLAVDIHGMPGVGKTALAVHWAHMVKSRFGDGQLFLDLRGYSDRSALTPGEALGQLLRSLGRDPKAIPADADERETLYRSLVSAKRMLIVLDDAASSEQVRPLLPGSATALAIVTSRKSLIGLVAHDGVRPFSVDVFAPDEALALVRKTLGERRVADEIAAAAELGRRCAYLPLALRIATANLAIHEHERIAGAVQELDAGDRLSRLVLDDDPGNAVRAAFELSYREQEEESRRAFRCLCLFDGPDFTAAAAAPLLEVEGGAVRELLRDLEQVHLVEAVSASRYRVHELLREYGRRQSEIEDDKAARKLAIHRLLAGYLSAVRRNRSFIAGYRRTVAGEPANPPDHVDNETRQAAFEWFETERGNLIAAVRQATSVAADRLAWELADALFDFFELHVYEVENEEVQRLGLAAARRAGDRRAECFMLRHLARIRRQLGMYDAALACAEHAYELSTELDDRHGEGDSLTELALTHRVLGHHEQSLSFAGRALAIWRECEDRVGEAETLWALGITHWHMGHYEAAQAYAAQALRIQRAIGDRRGEAASLDLMARASRRLGRYLLALEQARQALEISSAIDDRDGEGVTLDTIARVLARRREYDQALRDAHRALEIRREIGDRHGESETLDNLARLYRWLGDLQTALECAQNALAIQRRTGDPRGVAETLENLARIYRKQKDFDAAFAYAKQAIEIAQAIEDRERLAASLDTLGRTYLAVGRYDAALTYAEEAVATGSAATDPYGQAYRLYCCASVRLHMGEPAGALIPLRAALDIWREIGDRLGQIQTLEDVAEAYRALGDDAGAQRAEDEVHRLRVEGEDAAAGRTPPESTA